MQNTQFLFTNQVVILNDSFCLSGGKITTTDFLQAGISDASSVQLCFHEIF